MKYFRSHVYAAIWGIIMFALFVIPSKKFESEPIFEGVDKIVHCGLFFILSSILYYESLHKSNWSANKWITITKIVLATTAFAIGTELYQHYLTSSRSGDVWDAVADMIGVGMSTFAFMLFYKKRRKHK